MKVKIEKFIDGVDAWIVKHPVVGWIWFVFVVSGLIIDIVTK
jgi:uncharacterized membrane protein YesL